jgi:hypothetical protein
VKEDEFEGIFKAQSYSWVDKALVTTGVRPPKELSSRYTYLLMVEFLYLVVFSVGYYYWVSNL